MLYDCYNKLFRTPERGAYRLPARYSTVCMPSCLFALNGSSSKRIVVDSIATSEVSHTKMGWFSSSASSAADSAAASAPSAGAAAPDRSQRAQCWTSRDAYFGCLDKNNVQAPGQEGEGVCKAENDEYRSKCAASWVRSPSFLSFLPSLSSFDFGLCLENLQSVSSRGGITRC